MKNYRALIVEDEILIADTIKRYVQRKGYKVVGTAISYEEATDLYKKERPDITLLDISLSGSKTGVDVAQFIRAQDDACPFIFISSQTDRLSIESARETLPSGFLTKPIQQTSLFTTMEMAIYAHYNTRQKKQQGAIKLMDGQKNYRIHWDDILYLEADHIYVKVKTTNHGEILQRTSLKELMTQLPTNQFIQSHRSYVVNMKRVNDWDNASIYVQDQPISLSRSNRRNIVNKLKNR
ncbi:MAG: response regulator transcription factor [Bacteroidota bacterium]